MEELYYLQDSRSYVGNDLLFWAKEGKGYTTDVSKSQIYTKEQAQAQHNSRETDIPWPKAYIDAHTRPAVDHQYVRRAVALEGTGITIHEPKRHRPKPERCHACGGFMSDVQRYTTRCPKCGADNSP